MDKLINILKEVLWEANLEKDVDKERIAREYINKINSIIKGYKGDTKQISFVSALGIKKIEIFLPKIDIHFFNQYHGKPNGQFLPKSKGVKKPFIEIFHTKIEFDQSTNKLLVDYDENSLRHELIHFLDYKNIKTDPKDLQKNYKSSQEKDPELGYINNPLEVNAHFFELFMPEIMKVIEKQKELPDNVNEFIKNVLSEGKPKEFFELLKPENRKKVLKRLGTYYDILKNGNVEQNGKIDNHKLEKTTNTFISRLKKKIGF